MTSFGYRKNFLAQHFFGHLVDVKNMTNITMTNYNILVIDSAILILFYCMGKIFQKI